MNLSSNIRFLRRKANITQKGLADQLNKTSAAVGDYERGKAIPPLPVIIQLCDIFGVDLATIVFHDIERDGLPTSASAAPADDATEAQLRDQLQTQRRLTELQEQRLRTLEREIREQAPELAARLGL